MKNIIYLIAVLIGGTSIAQVGIGTVDPHPSSLLEVKASDKGLLIPRVDLKSETDDETIPNPANQLLAFSTGKGGLSKGLYYWDANDKQWIKQKEIIDENIVNRENFVGARYSGSSVQSPIACLLLSCTPVNILWDRASIDSSDVNYDSYYKKTEGAVSLLAGDDSSDIIIREDGVYQIDATATFFNVVSSSIGELNTQFMIYLTRNQNTPLGTISNDEGIIAKQSKVLPCYSGLSSISQSVSTTVALKSGDVIRLATGIGLFNNGLDIKVGLVQTAITEEAHNISIVKVGEIPGSM